MGGSEEVKPCKLEKPSSPAQDQTNMYVYPDWAAMQAYYGPRVAVPPYFNSAIASGHAPHPYMWGPPQAMMPPYGAPYAAVYAHGGVYVHPGVSLASTPPSTEAPGKSSGNSDRGLMKKLKGFNGLAMSIGNGNNSADAGAEHGDSPSAETEGSSDGNTEGASQNSRKRSRGGTPTIGGDGKNESKNGLGIVMDFNSASDIAGDSVHHIVAKKVVSSVLSPNMGTSLERGKPSADPKISPTGVAQHCAMVPNEAWFQNERELKRERRKQSNRDSARRSRLRKQAETEELAVRVESITAENMTLKSEINRLTANSEKLKLENASLVDKLKHAKIRQTENDILSKVNKKVTPPVCTKNLLSRVNNSGYIDRGEEDSDAYESNKKSGAKLHQLLDASPRTDAVAAS